MLIDLVLQGRDAVFVGYGKEATFKALKLVDAKARTTVLADRFEDELVELASKKGALVSLRREKITSSNLKRLLDEISPQIIFISTGNTPLDEELASVARRYGRRSAIICVVDDPRLNDFNMPAIGRMGDIRIGVSTGGKSPAMAALLSRKLERMLTREDVLQVRLQGQMRRLARTRLENADKRRAFAYRLIRDRKIKKLLKSDKFPAAKQRAEELLREAQD